MNKIKVEHTEITAEKVNRNIWIAKCQVESPIKSEVTMQGTSEENAIQKLKLFLNNEPYSHLK